MKHFPVGLVALIFASIVSSTVAWAHPNEHPDADTGTRVRGALRGLGVPFIQNEGQHPAEIGFHAETFAGTVFVTEDGRLLIVAPADEGSLGDAIQIEQSWVGARPDAPRGLDRSDTIVRTSSGPDPGKWRKDAPAFATLSLGEVYEGIELRLRAHGNNVEQLYFLAPGADPGLIEARVDGIEAMSIDEKGLLVLKTGAGSLTLTSPAAYQHIDGERFEVDAEYELTDEGYRFVLGLYDPSRELVIDPLLQASYLGGSGSESVNILLIHPDNGDIYIAGGTTSATFGVDGTVLASSNAYIARLDPDLTQYEFIQYLGGLGDESITHLAIHPPGSPRAGQMVVMGPSDSDGWPAVCYGERGNDSLFLAIFGTDLQSDFVRCVSGSVHDRPTALAIHPTSYQVYIAGETNSDDFPATEGGIQEARAGLFDAVVARLSPDLSSIVQATYLGGYSGGEVEVSLAIDALEGLYLTGRTNSGNRGTIDDDDWPNELMASLDPPVEPPQGAFGGGIEDLFVGLLNAELTEPKMVSYLGGNGMESSNVRRLVIHPSDGMVYVAGKTESDNADPLQGIQWSPGVFVVRYSAAMDAIDSFATLTASSIDDILYHSSGNLYVLGTTGETLPAEGTAAALQPSYGGGLGDGFVAYYDAELQLERATYLGGSDREGGQAFLEHPLSGAIYVTGYTFSMDYPRAQGGAQSSSRGFREGFVARLAPDLSNAAQSQSTYYGGAANDWSRVVLIDPDLGDVYIAGVTDSSDLPGTGGGAQPDAILDPEGFVALFDQTLTGGPGPEIEVDPPSYAFGELAVGSRSGPVELTIRNIGSAGLIVQSLSNSDASNFILVSNGGTNGCSPARPFTLEPSQSCTFTAEFAPSASGAFTANVTIESNDLDERNVRVPLTGTGVEGGTNGDSPQGCDCAVPGEGGSPIPFGVVLLLGILSWRRLRDRRC